MGYRQRGNYTTLRPEICQPMPVHCPEEQRHVHEILTFLSIHFANSCSFFDEYKQ